MGKLEISSSPFDNSVPPVRDMLVGIDNWVASVSDRIGVLSERGLSPIKTETLQVVLAETKFTMLRRLSFAGTLEVLSNAYQNDLLVGPNHLDIHPSAAFLPAALATEEINARVIDADREYTFQLHNLALRCLREVETDSGTLDQVVHESAAAHLNHSPTESYVQVWQLFYSLLRRRQEYQFNEPTQVLYEQLLQYQKGCNPKLPVSTVCAAIFCYYMDLLQGDRPERSREYFIGQARNSSGWFWEALVRENFPDGFGNIFQMPDSLR